MNAKGARCPCRGVTLTELVWVVGCAVLLIAMGLPIFRRVGCDAMREHSKANLARLSSVHAAYAADWSGRQYTMVPDYLGAYGGSFSQWEDAVGCAPRTVLGHDSIGNSYEVGTACGSDGAPWVAESWTKPLSFSEYSLGGIVGAYRLANARLVSVYLDGRFYDETFYAPDDPLVTKELRKVQQAGGDFEPISPSFIPSTYTYSPAAMFDPRVLGLGSPNAANPTYNDPNSAALLNGEGYRSPSVAQCVHPALKTQLMEMWTIENPPAPCQPGYPDCLPYVWNQSTFSRPLAAFFDGSVRIFTPREAMYTEDRSNMRLWVRNTPVGSGNSGSADYFANTKAHFLTSFGIAGRDTVAY